jgi:hypothetical protein
MKKKRRVLPRHYNAALRCAPAEEFCYEDKLENWRRRPKQWQAVLNIAIFHPKFTPNSAPVYAHSGKFCRI